MAEESKIKALEERIEELEEKIEDSDSDSKVERKGTGDALGDISRRDFLRKVGLGSLGFGALLSPVSADYFIKDDSFSVQTSNDGGDTLSEGVFVDQNQNVDIPNGNLNVQGNRAATRNWAQNQEWITASQAPVQSVNGRVGNVTIETGQNPSYVYGDGQDGNINHSTNTSSSGIIYAKSYTIENGATVNIENGEPLVIFAQDGITINGTIDGKGSGAGPNQPAKLPFYATGSGGQAYGGDGGPGAGGAGGRWEYSDGFSDDGDDAPGFASDGISDLSEFDNSPVAHLPIKKITSRVLSGDIKVAGSGGGRGGQGDNPGSNISGGVGGRGGALVYLVAPTVSGKGHINVSGSDGGNGEDGDYTRGGGGGGGGGSGGFIFINGNEVSDNLSFDVGGGSGGSGGSGDEGGSDGGEGGDGVAGDYKIYTY